MKIVDKGYAKIYVDTEQSIIGYINGTDNLEEAISHFFDDLMVKDYYSNPGHIQWNYYYICPMDNIPLEIQYKICNNDVYCRKMFVPGLNLDTFIESTFPDYVSGNDAVFYLIHGENASKTAELDKSIDLFTLIRSFMYEYNELDTLWKLDEIRSVIINSQGLYKYYTHIDLEASYVKKKFSFMGNNFKVIKYENG